MTADRPADRAGKAGEARAGEAGETAAAATDDASPAEQPATGTQAVVRALEVRQSAKRSLAFAAVFAVALTLYFVVVVAGGQTEAPLGYYPLLAFVVFVTTAMLATTVLVVRRVLALGVHPASLVRKTAAVGVLAGGCWLVAAVALQFGPVAPWSSIVDVATPWAPVCTLAGLWALYTRYKRTALGRPLVVLGTLVALVGALVLADLAAVSLVSLLPDVGRGVDPRTASLVRGGAALLVGGQALVAVLGGLGEGDWAVPLLVAIPPVVGLAGMVALPAGRVGLGVFAAGMGVGWALAGWQLRGVGEDDVPDGAATLPGEPASPE